jgi:hypothetical protein
MRHAMGVAVFSGMIGVTFFGLLLTPVFYVVVMNVGRIFNPSRRPADLTSAPRSDGLEIRPTLTP